MGQEARCTLRFAGRRSEGKALLESKELVFRGAFRLSVPFSKIRSVSATKGVLSVDLPEGKAAFELGPVAAAWAEQIRSPKPLIDKLGLKPGLTVSVLKIDDAGFLRQAAARAARVATGRPASRSDLIFLGVETARDLGRLRPLKTRMRKDGGIWVIWRKGRPELKEDDVRAAALAAGLVDVKVVAFSPTHSALKLVIPVAKR